MSKSFVAGAVAARAKSAEKSSPPPNSEVRDELVRAVMPELRVLMEHLVSTAVERSLAPLLDKQRELEAALNELRNTQLHSAQSVSTPAKQSPDYNNAARVHHVEANPFVAPAAQTVPQQASAPVPAVAVVRPAVSAQPYVAPSTAYNRNAMADDIPFELNGSRRRKAVAWAFAVVVVLLLCSVIGLAVMSNMGITL